MKKLKGRSLRVADASSVTRLLRASEQVLTVDDNAALQVARKDLRAISAVIDAGKATSQLKSMRLRKQQRRFYRNNPIKPSDSLAHTAIDNSYVVAQGADALAPDETYDKNVGVTGGRKLVHGTARSLGVIALSEKKPGKAEPVLGDIDELSSPLVRDTPRVRDTLLDGDTPRVRDTPHVKETLLVGDTPLVRDTTSGKNTSILSDDRPSNRRRPAVRDNIPTSMPAPVRTRDMPPHTLPRSSQTKNINTRVRAGDRRTSVTPRAQPSSTSTSTRPIRERPREQPRRTKLLRDASTDRARRNLIHEAHVPRVGTGDSIRDNIPGSGSTISENAVRELGRTGARKLHQKISEVENENVAVKAAHKLEQTAEDVVRTTRKMRRYTQNHPRRQLIREGVQSVKSQKALAYRQLLNDNPGIRRNPVARMYYKRKIKRMYAAQYRAAQSGTNVAITRGAATRTTLIKRTTHKFATLLKKAGFFVVKGGLLLLLLVLIVSVLQMCMSLVSGGGMLIGLSYTAEEDDITQASIAYTDWETALWEQILDTHITHPSYHEYRLYINGVRRFSGSSLPQGGVRPALRGAIGHDPFELMAFLTAMYNDFAFSDVEETLRYVFNAQYQLSTSSTSEMRQTYAYQEQLQGGEPTLASVYAEWNILSVSLNTTPMHDVLLSLMDESQQMHYELLVWSMGMRQFIYSPFAFNWLPFVSSQFGYRIHPISGQRSMHTGIDVAQPTGVELLAGIEGVVTFAGEMGGYGLIVFIVCHEHGIELRYAHCNQIFVSVGQMVSPGDVIATVGASGNVTGPHLHMEVRVDGQLLNPIFFVHTNALELE